MIAEIVQNVVTRFQRNNSKDPKYLIIGEWFELALRSELQTRGGVPRNWDATRPLTNYMGMEIVIVQREEIEVGL